ncbi:hypothetical protein AB1Y20_002553 [Prymnesium parvum]|uniref:PBP domain-containing protein n=1 Tax=Prymnesium parvum TaxID=97485 RepID=A0AB34J9D1_PRYPA
MAPSLAMAALLASSALAHSYVPELHGSGTTNPSRLFWQLMDLMEERSKELIHMTYRATGSSVGMAEFAAGGVGLNHFGSGDIPLTSSWYNNITSTGREVLHIPFALGGIGVFHSVPTAELGSAGALNLTGCVLAKIFSRTITVWNDPEIIALNPGMTASAAIKVVHRIRGSSSTAGFTEYLQTKCGGSWGLSSGSTIVWPTGTYEAQGSGGMSDFIAQNEYSIGYIDAGHGHAAGLGEVALENKDGVYLTTKQADIGAAAIKALSAVPAVIPANPSDDFSAVNLYDLEGPTTWPITMISYLYVNKNQSTTDPESAGLLMAFMRMLLSDEGQNLAVNNLFSKLPAELLTYDQNALDSIILPADAPTYTFETSTQPLNGASDTVISSNRRSYAEYERSATIADLETLQASVTAMEARVAEVESVQATNSVIQLHGGGTTNPSKLFWQAMDLIAERSRLTLHMTYRAIGSSTGQREFEGQAPSYTSLNHFGSGDIPMPKERYDSIKAAGRTMLHIPFALGGIGVFHSVPSGAISGDLETTPCLLAQIFSRKITKWNDQRILDLNPTLTATSDIKVVHRVAGSSSTAGFTEYLQAVCPEEWIGLTGSTIAWPEGTASAEGSGGMADYIATHEGAIGYIDAGHGVDAGLAEVALQNKDGVYLTTKQADIGAAAREGLTANVIPASATDDFSAVNLYNLPGPTTWPITMISYIYVDQDLRAMRKETAALLVYFIQFILSDEGQAIATNKYNLFSKLPVELESYNAVALSTLLLPAGTTRFTTEFLTLPYAGAGTYVISGKRRSYAELERERTLDYVYDLQPSAAEEHDDDEHKHQDTYDKAVLGLALGAAGLGLGGLALIIAIITLIKVNSKSVPRSAEIQARQLEPPGSTTKSSV